MESDSREIALSVLLDMDKNKTFSSIALSKALKINQFTDKKNRAFASRLVEGVTEYMLLIDYVINKFSKTKVKKLRPQIRCILRMGVYQILYMDSVPDNAACNESVKLAKKHGMSSLSGYVNGVLRNIAREKENEKLLPDEMWIKYSTPEWLCNFFIETFGKEKAEKIIAAQYIARGTTIRVNQTLISKEELKKKIEEAGINVEYGKYDDNALIISDYDFIRKVPGFRQGEFSVQDESSMCTIKAAGIKDGDRVLDVCAAPGGKSLYTAELLKESKGSVLSRDLTEEKTGLIKDNAERLKLDNITVEEYDATEFDDSCENGFDVVICDVPCSGLGIIGRKNDIKYRITSEQMTELSELGLRILLNAGRYVKTGGTLCFSTCTINPDENENNANRFLKENSCFEKISEKTFLQGIDDCDGFYYCIMRKK